MPLNVAQGSGDYANRFKYDARAGKSFFIANKAETELEKPKFIANFKNVKTGWSDFTGSIPVIKYDPSLEVVAPKPENGDFKRYVELPIFLKEHGDANFGSQSALVSSAISDLFDEYESQIGANAGKLPVVQIVGTEAIKNKTNNSTNYKPVMKITAWVDKPADMGAAPVQETVAADDEAEF